MLLCKQTRSTGTRVRAARQRVGYPARRRHSRPHDAGGSLVLYDLSGGSYLYVAHGWREVGSATSVVAFR